MTFNYKNTINYLIFKEELNNCLTKSYFKDVIDIFNNIIGYCENEFNIKLAMFNKYSLNEIEKQLDHYLDEIYSIFVYYSVKSNEVLKEKCEDILPQYNITKIQLELGNVLRDIKKHYNILLNESKDKKLAEIQTKLFKFNAAKCINSSNEIYILLYYSYNKSTFSFPEKHSSAILPKNKVLNSIVSFSVVTYSINLDDQDSKDFILYLGGLGIDYKEIEIKDS